MGKLKRRPRGRPRPRMQESVWKALHALATEFDPGSWPHEEVFPKPVLNSLLKRGWVELFEVEPTLNLNVMEPDDRFVRLTPLGVEAHREMLADLQANVPGDPA